MITHAQYLYLKKLKEREASREVPIEAIVPCHDCFNAGFTYVENKYYYLTFTGHVALSAYEEENESTRN